MGPKGWLTVLLWLLLAVAALRGVAAIYIPRIMFHPEGGDSLLNPGMLDLPYEEVSIPSGDARLHGWAIPSPGNPRRDPLVIFFHGNAGTIGNRIDFVRFMREGGLSFLVVDYRGYGKSGGTSTPGTVGEDARQTVRFAREAMKVAPERIVLWGRSLGGAAAVEAAVANPDLAGIVAESTFVSLREIARVIAPWMPSLFVPDRLRSGEGLAALAMPKLILHGDADEIIPYAQGEALAAMARPPRQFVPLHGARHNGAWQQGGAPYRALVAGWIREQAGGREESAF